MTENVYAIANRHKKVAALVDALQRANISLSMAELASEGDWRLAAIAAGVNPPSAKTIALVLEMMADIENHRTTMSAAEVEMYRMGRKLEES